MPSLCSHVRLQRQKVQAAEDARNTHMRPLTAKMGIGWRRFDGGVRSSLQGGRTDDGVVFTLIAPVATLT